MDLVYVLLQIFGLIVIALVAVAIVARVSRGGSSSHRDEATARYAEKAPATDDGDRS